MNTEQSVPYSDQDVALTGMLAGFIGPDPGSGPGPGQRLAAVGFCLAGWPR